MLPSTGYFKAINCPFYDNGYCERPYCHFRHSRRGNPILALCSAFPVRDIHSRNIRGSASISEFGSNVSGYNTCNVLCNDDEFVQSGVLQIYIQNVQYRATKSCFDAPGDVRAMRMYKFYIFRNILN